MMPRLSPAELIALTNRAIKSARDITEAAKAAQKLGENDESTATQDVQPGDAGHASKNQPDDKGPQEPDPEVKKPDADPEPDTQPGDKKETGPQEGADAEVERLARELEEAAKAKTSAGPPTIGDLLRSQKALLEHHAMLTGSIIDNLKPKE
jgi:hypothetical protein